MRYPVYKWTRHNEKCKTKERAYVFVTLCHAALGDLITFPVGLMGETVVTTEHQWLHRNVPLGETKTNVGNS